MPGYSYQIISIGFDKLFAHFARISQANQEAIADFQQSVASQQTQTIKVDFDVTIKSRTGNTRAAIQPFVNIGRSMGTHQVPIEKTIQWLNWGTGLYGPVGESIHIQARNKKYLHFFWLGKEFYRKSVNVKGIHPRAFIENGIYDFQAQELPKLIAALRQKLTELANTVGWNG